MEDRPRATYAALPTPHISCTFASHEYWANSSGEKPMSQEPTLAQATLNCKCNQEAPKKDSMTCRGLGAMIDS